MHQNQALHNDSKTAVLLFSRSLEEEYKAKPFGLTYRKFKRIYHYLLRNTRKAIHESGLPMVESFSWDQYGSSFSQRLSDSVRKAFRQGFERVIVVGNDAPYLSGELIQKAERLLDQGRPVIGANERGGTYLMAFGKDCFKKADFEAVNWETDEVFEQLKHHLKPSVLEQDLTDVNVKSDLLKLIDGAKQLSAQLSQLLKELFATENYKSGPERPANIEFFYNDRINRGPPELINLPF